MSIPMQWHWNFLGGTKAFQERALKFYSGVKCGVCKHFQFSNKLFA